MKKNVDKQFPKNVSKYQFQIKTELSKYLRDLNNPVKADT